MNGNLGYSGTITYGAVTYLVGLNSTPNYFGGAQIVVGGNTQVVISGTYTSGAFLVDAFLVAGSAGTIAYWWGQNSSNASASTLQPGTTMTVERIA
jgi:hypothetical protein